MISAFLTKLISMSLMSISAIGAIFLFKKILSHRLSPKGHLYVWLPVLLCLFIPHSFSSKMSVYNYVPDEKVISVYFTFHSSEQSYVATIADISPKIHINPLFIIWLIGFLISFIIPIISFYKFKKALIPSDKNTSTINNEIKKYASLQRLKNFNKVFICKNEISPMILGILRPVIIIPESVLKNFSDEQISVVILHECIHLKRRDRYVNLLLMICTGIHWFNPLVRCMCKQIRHDLENVCDEITMQSLDESHQKIYADTILDILEMTDIRFINSLSSTMASTKNTLKSRIINICNFNKERLKLIVLPVTIIITTTLLTGAVSKRAESAAQQISDNIEKITDEILPEYTISEDKEKDKNINNQNNTPTIHSDNTYTHKNEIISDDNINEIESNNRTESNIDIESVYEVTAEESTILSNEDTKESRYSSNKPSYNFNDSQDISTKKPNKSDNENLSNHTANKPNNESLSNQTTNKSNSETIETDDNVRGQKTKIYTYSSDEATGKFSSDKYSSGFASDNGYIRIDTVGLISSSDSNLSGYFNIYRDGELVGESVRANVSASPNSINFNQTVGSEHDYVFSVHTKTVDEQ